MLQYNQIIHYVKSETAPVTLLSATLNFCFVYLALIQKGLKRHNYLLYLTCMIYNVVVNF